MDKKWIGVIAIIIIAIVACGAYFIMGSGDENTVNIGYLPSDHDSALFVAQAQNKYEDKNITVKTTQFNNGGDLMTAMASGDIDVGYVGITPVLSSIEKGVPVKVVSAAQTEGSGIVVAKNSGIKSIADLKGKTVATPGEASIQFMLLKYALEKENVDISTVSVPAMKVASMSDSLKAGKIDAMLTYEPYVSISTSAGYGEELADSSEILDNHPCCVVVASDDFIANHPDTLKDILDIHKDATEFINENPADAAKLLPSDIVPDANVEATSLENINFISGLDDNYKKSVIDFMGIEIDMGILKQAISEDKIFAEI